MRDATSTIEQMPADDAERWCAVLERDSAADGRFVYAVITTGVFCRPSCGSRRPRRENVRFFESAEAASAAGFRSCRKCFSDRSLDALIAEACHILSDGEMRTVWSDVAARLGVSDSYLHRRFREKVGMTPGAYARAQRAERFRGELVAGEPVASALYGAGYGSSGRAYERADADLGMTPQQYRKGGQGVPINYSTTQCSLGWVLAARTDRGVCAVEIGESDSEVRRRLAERFPEAQLVESPSDLLGDVVQLIEHPEHLSALPLDVRGTAFQHRVWSALRQIPIGTTATYSEIAERIGSPDAVRAVAGACAANPIAVIVPCHRVQRSDGGLGGYRWGIDRKKQLLERERKENS